MGRILMIGCGDIAMRVARLLRSRHRLFGLVRNPAHCAALRAAGIVPVRGDLDDSGSLHRLSGLGQTVLHFAPPPTAITDNTSDTRTRNLLAALSRGSLPQRLIYISTSGVYGDCNGELVTETRPVHPQTARAKLRINAENQIRCWAGIHGIHASILRVPGIYATDRLPLERLKKCIPAIIDAEDGYTNHIHADDLAQCVIAAMRYAKPNRIYHTVDDSRMKMGEYFDAVADAYTLPRTPRLARAEVRQILTPIQYSFMNESRRLSNMRMKQELKLELRYPTVAQALKEISLSEIRPRCLTEPVAPASASPHLRQLPLPLF